MASYRAIRTFVADNLDFAPLHFANVGAGVANPPQEPMPGLVMAGDVLADDHPVVVALALIAAADEPPSFRPGLCAMSDYVELVA
jgi:hypothetical protein